METASTSASCSSTTSRCSTSPDLSRSSRAPASSRASRPGAPRRGRPSRSSRWPGPATPVTATGGLTVVPRHGFADAPRIDLLVVPGGFGTRRLLNDEETLGWIRRTAAAARQVTSVCTGALLLAKAGLLQGRRATTHWASLDLLDSLGAGVTVERDLPGGRRRRHHLGRRRLRDGHGLLHRRDPLRPRGGGRDGAVHRIPAVAAGYPDPASSLLTPIPCRARRALTLSTHPLSRSLSIFEPGASALSEVGYHE